MARRTNSGRHFIILVVPVMILWIVFTGGFMSHLVNLVVIIPGITMLSALFIPPRILILTVVILILHTFNLFFLDYGGPYPDVSGSSDWVEIGLVIVANIVIATFLASIMRKRQESISAKTGKYLGVLFKAGGIVLVVTGSLISWFIWHNPPSHDAEIYYLMILGALLLGGFLWYRGRQYNSIARKVAVESDVRPPVLYLRSFASDESALQASLSFLINSQMLPRGRGEERQLASAVDPLGPLVAVGKPGEGLPKPGAYRMYISDVDDWRSHVDELISKARLVIIRIEASGEGLWWEVSRALEFVDDGRLLLLFMLGRKKQRKAVAKMNAIPHFDGEVPGYSYLWFKPDGSTQTLKLRAPFWRTPVFRFFRVRSRYALRPVFEFLGIDWTRPPISFSRILVTVALILLALIILIVLVGNLIM